MRLAAIFTAIVMLASGAACTRGFDGKQRQLQRYRLGGLYFCSPAAATVGAGTEFDIGRTGFEQTILGDFTASGLTLTFTRDVFLGSTIVNFSDLSTAFTGASLLNFAGISGFSSSNVSFANGLLTVDLRGTTDTNGGTINLAVSNVNATPEPSSMALLGTGLLGIVGTFRRREA